MDWYNVTKEELDFQTGFRTILSKYYGNSLYKVCSNVLSFSSLQIFIDSKALGTFFPHYEIYPWLFKERVPNKFWTDSSTHR